MYTLIWGISSFLNTDIWGHKFLSEHHFSCISRILVCYVFIFIQMKIFSNFFFLLHFLFNRGLFRNVLLFPSVRGSQASFCCQVPESYLTLCDPLGSSPLVCNLASLWLKDVFIQFQLSQYWCLFPGSACGLHRGPCCVQLDGALWGAVGSGWLMNSVVTASVPCWPHLLLF